jgi:hypothetical protein
LKLGIVGRGWGNAYAQVLRKFGIEFWHAGRDWRKKGNADGVIIASTPESHFPIAMSLLADGVPVLIEKPVTLCSREATALVGCGGIAFAGHTRLYSPAWREFKKPAKEVRATVADWWGWGPHAVAMSLDLGCEPQLTVGGERMTFFADGREFQDVATDPTPLEVLVKEFIAAIESGKPNNEGLQLGLRVVQFLESHELR